MSRGLFQQMDAVFSSNIVYLRRTQGARGNDIHMTKPLKSKQFLTFPSGKQSQIFQEKL